MAGITLKQIHKTYGDRHLLRGVDLVIDEEDRVGLVGVNGCGKSTLLRILAGSEVADDGERTTRRELRVGYLEQEPELPADATIVDAVRRGLGEHADVLRELDDVHARLAAPDVGPDEIERLLKRQSSLDDRLEAIGGHDIEHRIEATVTALGLPDGSARCGELSGGERRRVALAQLLLSEPDVLLLDEPTNHLDAEVVGWLEDLLAKSKAAVVLVTHDRYFLDRVVDRVVELDRGDLHEYRGGYTGFVTARAERLAREDKAEATRLNLLRRETEWMRRGPPARTTKSKKRIERYETLRDGGREAERTDLDFRIPCAQRLGDKVLRLEGIGKSYGDRSVLRGVTLEIGKGQRVGILGPNGAGKSTLLKICMGLLEPDAGEVDVGPTVKFAFVDQARSNLNEDATVIEEVAQGNTHVVLDGGQSLRIESYLDRMLFPSSTQRTRVGDLSGGERNRVVLAKLLAESGNVVVLDEPTNDLDLMTLRVLEDALVAFSGTVLVVSHDRWFLDRVATRVVAVRGDGGIIVHEGDASALLERLAGEREAAAAAAAKARRKSASTPSADAEAVAKPKRLSSREKDELAGLPDAIATAESALESIDEELADPSLYDGADGAERSRALTDRRVAAQAEVERLYARWEELESRAS